MITESLQMFQRPYWSRKKLEEYQLNLLRRRLAEARKNVPIYKKSSLPMPESIQSLEDWTQLPILYKNDLTGANSKERINHNFQLDELVVSKSSGSTGQALDVYYDQKSYNLFILAGLRMYQMGFSYRPWHKQVYIYTSPYPIKSLMGFYPMHFIPTVNEIEDTIAQLKKIKPDFLVCYPSHLRSIADKMSSQDKRSLSLKAINVNSEMSTQSERDSLAEQFNCPVFDEYSSEELTRIASQCSHQKYHIFSDINYIEIVDENGQLLPEGEEGCIVGTNLHNKGAPLLRYFQGDRGSITHESCPCGRNFPILKTFSGRKNDSFRLASGEILSSGYLLDLTYSVFLDFPNQVSAFCLVQLTADNWQLELVPGQAWQLSSQEQIYKALCDKLNRPEINLLVKLVEQVSRTQSGKANPIVSRLGS